MNPPFAIAFYTYEFIISIKVVQTWTSKVAPFPFLSPFFWRLGWGTIFFRDMNNGISHSKQILTTINGRHWLACLTETNKLTNSACIQLACWSLVWRGHEGRILKLDSLFLLFITLLASELSVISNLALMHVFWV